MCKQKGLLERAMLLMISFAKEDGFNPPFFFVRSINSVITESKPMTQIPWIHE